MKELSSKTNRFIPEILAPAGSLSKLKTAVLYGAHAVYLGGLKFGLRAASDNFTELELEEGVSFAHERGAKVYVVLNGFLHDKDLDELPEFVELLDRLKVDAVIVSDLGVIETVKQYSDIEIHLSTQASCLNIESAKLWKNMGVKRIVLGREVSIADAGKIKKEVDIEIEMFIHGSMCMAYSGNCVISNYTQGRDSNRGGCAHSCRFEYKMEYSKNEMGLNDQNSFFMSSKDLSGIELLPYFIEHEIDSLKVEGRMKGPHYAGTIPKVYREAIDYYIENNDLNSKDLESWQDELNKVTHRDYTFASLNTPADETSVYDKREHEEKEYVIAGVVMDVVENEFIILEVRSKFFKGETLELVPFKGKSSPIDLEFLTEVTGEEIENTRPGILVKIPYHPAAKRWNMVRKRIVQ